MRKAPFIILLLVVEPVGRYAVRLVFDDGHDTGLYTWAVLHDLCLHYDRKWRRYLERVAAAGGVC